MTTSPTATSTGTRLPLSSIRPGPTARTLPSWGFSFAVSGITRPEAVVVSASLAWTTILSSSGLMFTLTGLTSTVVESVGRLRYGSCHPAVAGVGAVAGAVHLALYPRECQRFNDPPAPGG